ncbi:glycosyltransferase family 2 protein [Candidatus Dependentiae bacterium]|nr:glycosyltransferase family 2 protein [Candidatus Dependentiae bacterium]
MYKKIGALSCITLFFSFSVHTHDTNDTTVVPEFAILIPSYNNEQYCIENLESVIYQKSSKPYQVFVINDCSTDKTGELLDSFVRNHNLQSLVTLIHNDKRCGSLENIYSVIHNYIDDHKVVVSVEGADQLASDEVLMRLEKEYENPTIHLTYGSFIRSSTGKPGKIRIISDKVIQKGALRKELKMFSVSHLKTFRAGLFKKIKKEDLMFNEAFFPLSEDSAFMYPMIEMLTPTKKTTEKHIAFIPDILYKYTGENLLNDSRMHRKKQQFFDLYIKQKKCYRQLDTAVLKIKGE